MIYQVQETRISYKKEVITPKCNCAKVAVDVFRSIDEVKEKMEWKEVVYSLYLNNANDIIGVMKISEGGITNSICDVRIIMQGALFNNATGFIILHNHPAGNLDHSEVDKKMFNSIKEAGKIMGIRCLDSIVVTTTGHNSIN